MYNLNEKQALAMEKIASGKNIYISGPGGHGKSILVESIKSRFEDSCVLCAPTGISALNISGSTIHSTFKLGTSMLTKKHWSSYSQKAEELFNKNGPVKILIIDEISMVRSDLLVTVDQQLRRIRRLNIPFGGLQVVVVGDFYQLPPVLQKSDEKVFNELYDSIFCFSNETWSSASFEHVELSQNMRQSDEEFRKHLGRIRKKSSNVEESIEFFNSNSILNKDYVYENDPIFLCAYNNSADDINKHHYEQLGGKELSFFAEKKGDFKIYPSPQKLDLKYGTKIIFTCNGPDFKNGELGYFVGQFKDKIHILKEDETEVFVSKQKWENKEYEVAGEGLTTKVSGTYTQYPIKYAWAISIHKSQGLTLDDVVIDWSKGTFVSGQCYVALSRLRKISGLTMTRNLYASDIIISDEVNEFYKNDCKGIGIF